VCFFILKINVNNSKIGICENCFTISFECLWLEEKKSKISDGRWMLEVKTLLKIATAVISTKMQSIAWRDPISKIHAVKLSF